MPPTCQFSPTAPHRGGAGDLIVGDIVSHECAGAVAHQHVASAGATQRAEAGHLPVQPDCAPGFHIGMWSFEFFLLLSGRGKDFCPRSP